MDVLTTLWAHRQTLARRFTASSSSLGLQTWLLSRTNLSSCRATTKHSTKLWENTRIEAYPGVLAVLIVCTLRGTSVPPNITAYIQVRKVFLPLPMEWSAPSESLFSRWQLAIQVPETTNTSSEPISQLCDYWKGMGGCNQRLGKRWVHMVLETKLSLVCTWYVMADIIAGHAWFLLWRKVFPVCQSWNGAPKLSPLGRTSRECSAFSRSVLYFWRISSISIASHPSTIALQRVAFCTTCSYKRMDSWMQIYLHSLVV